MSRNRCNRRSAGGNQAETEEAMEDEPVEETEEAVESVDEAEEEG